MSQWTHSLNPEQTDAVLHNKGPLLILAGAGSGKTTVLVTRTGRLIDEGVTPAKNIVVLTFTNKSALELKDRVQKKVGKKSRGITAGTFHSFGVSILKKHYQAAGLPKSFGIIDSGDSRAILRDLVKHSNHYDKENVSLEKLLNLISQWRQAGKTKVADSDPDDPYLELTQVLLPKYIKQLELLGVVDFEGLLLKPIEIFQNNSAILAEYQYNIKQLMVDEFQDTNLTQMKLINMLIEPDYNICVVGDDDQSIYGWRGAEVSNILNFPKNYKDCKVVRLERNYRSTSSILSIANQLIKKNSVRHNKALRAEGYEFSGDKPELMVYPNEEEEALEIVQNVIHFRKKGFDYKDIAILYRSNSQGGLLEGDLRRADIPYKLTGGTEFFERREVKDAMAFLQCAFKPNEVSVRRVLNVPSRGIGEKTILFFEKIALEKNISFVEVILDHPLNLDQKEFVLLKKFRDIVNKLRLSVLTKTTDSIGEKYLEGLAEVNYKDFVYSSYKDHKTAHSRWTMVELFTRVMNGYTNKNGVSEKSLRGFIDAMMLRDIVSETANSGEEDKVQLMTLHACKGLEFPVVFIVGCEEDIIPHKTLGQDIEEERRLFYVGLTRAKKHLVLTRAELRKRFGKLRPSAPSRFLLEIPEELITEYADGCRPLSDEGRRSLLDDLYAKLDEQSLS